MNNINFNVLAETMKAFGQDPSLAMKPWQAKITWKDGVQNTIKIREFDEILVDEPQPLGGTDLAPNPVEYLIGAAASCFIITFEVLASQEGIALEEVAATIDANLNAAVFLGLMEGEGGILDPKITFNVKADADKEKLAKIAEIALSKSPVLLSLKMKIDFEY